MFKPAARLRTHESTMTPKPSQDDTGQAQNFSTNDETMLQ